MRPRLRPSTLRSRLTSASLSAPGENWIDETYDKGEGPLPGWELPASWAQAIPTRGRLTLTYTSDSALGCAPTWELRRELCQYVCVRPVHPDEGEENVEEEDVEEGRATGPRR